MAADKVQCKKVGEAVVALVAAVADGIDLSDTNSLIGLVTAIADASDDIKSDKDAAISYVLAGAAEAFGDSKVG